MYTITNGVAKKARIRITSLGLAALLVISGSGASLPLLFSEDANATASPEVVYNALPSVSPQTNYPSQPFQAQQTDEFGDYVHLGGTARDLNSVTVTMSNWAKYSDYASNPAWNGDSSHWTYPVTINVYSNHLSADGAPDQKLATVKQDVSIPWRPESDPSCGNTSNGKGWKVADVCYDYSGLAFNATFDFSDQGVILPDDVIIGVALDTQTWGYSPTGVAGPYNSLNVAVPDGQTASTGSDDSSDEVFWNTHTCGYYSNPGTCNTFRKDTGWTPYGTVALAIHATPVDTSSTTFVNDPKYVRANNGGDLSAQVVTPDSTEDVRFYVDGDTSTPLPSTNVGGAGANTSWWRLYTPLAPGEHTIAAQIKVSGHWYDISDTGTTYSLDAPWAEYVIPQSNQYYRPNDKVTRVKADDEFNQFNYMKTTIGSTTYTVNRAECSDQGNYVLCDLQNLNLPEGSYQADTTAYTKANNRVDHLMSPTFIIDGTKPSLSDFQIIGTQSIYGDSVNVSANASDTNEVKNVTFYVTAPRAGDGVCDGNGTHLLSATGALSSGSTYAATLDTSSLTGPYCLNAIAQDKAANHSAISKIKATFDNDAPAQPTSLAIYQGHNSDPANVLPDGGYTNSTKIRITWAPNTESDLKGYWFGTKTNPHHKWIPAGTTHYDGNMTPGSSSYYYKVSAVDNNDNESPVATTHQIGLDQENPAIAIGSVSEDPISGTVTINGTAGDAVSGLRDNSIRLSFRPIVSGNVQSPVKTFTVPVSGGTWSLTVDTTAHSQLSDGDYRVVARANDTTGTSYGNSNTASDTEDVTVDNTAPSAPIASPAGGTYDTAQTVTLSSSDSGSGLAGIYYTTDGSDPATSGTRSLYDTSTAGIVISGDTTIRAIAYDTAGNASGVLTADYVITPPPAPSPSFFVPTGFTPVFFGAAQGNANAGGNAAPGGANANNAGVNGGVAGADGAADGQVLAAATDAPNAANNGGNTEVKGLSTTNPENKQATQSSGFLVLGWWWLAVLAGLGLFFALLLRKTSDKTNNPVS